MRHFETTKNTYNDPRKHTFSTEIDYSSIKDLKIMINFDVLIKKFDPKRVKKALAGKKVDFFEDIYNFKESLSNLGINVELFVSQAALIEFENKYEEVLYGGKYSEVSVEAIEAFKASIDKQLKEFKVTSDENYPNFLKMAEEKLSKLEIAKDFKRKDFKILFDALSNNIDLILTNDPFYSEETKFIARFLLVREYTDYPKDKEILSMDLNKETPNDFAMHFVLEARYDVRAMVGTLFNGSEAFRKNMIKAEDFSFDEEPVNTYAIVNHLYPIRVQKDITSSLDIALRFADGDVLIVRKAFDYNINISKSMKTFDVNIEFYDIWAPIAKRDEHLYRYIYNVVFGTNEDESDSIEGMHMIENFMGIEKDDWNELDRKFRKSWKGSSTGVSNAGFNKGYEINE